MTAKPRDIEEVNSMTISCRGSTTDPSAGHPKIWLKISSDKGSVTCPYCEKIFVLKLD